MKIYSMTATFGKLEHETLTLEPGLNVIEAPNEWGKSNREKIELHGIVELRVV